MTGPHFPCPQHVSWWKMIEIYIEIYSRFIQIHPDSRSSRSSSQQDLDSSMMFKLIRTSPWNSSDPPSTIGSQMSGSSCGPSSISQYSCPAPMGRIECSFPGTWESLRIIENPSDFVGISGEKFLRSWSLLDERSGIPSKDRAGVKLQVMFLDSRRNTQSISRWASPIEPESETKPPQKNTTHFNRVFPKPKSSKSQIQLELWQGVLTLSYVFVKNQTAPLNNHGRWLCPLACAPKGIPSGSHIPTISAAAWVTAAATVDHLKITPQGFRKHGGTPVSSSVLIRCSAKNE